MIRMGLTDTNISVGLDQARVRSQQALVVRCTVATIATLLIQMAGTRKKKRKQEYPRQELFEKAA